MVFATRVDDERIDIAPVGEGNSDVLEGDITEVIVEGDEVQSGLGILHETAKIIGRLHGPVAEDHSEKRESMRRVTPRPPAASNPSSCTEPEKVPR